MKKGEKKIREKSNAGKGSIKLDRMIRCDMLISACEVEIAAPCVCVCVCVRCNLPRCD